MLDGHHCSLDTLYDTIVKKEPKAVEPKLAKQIKAKAEEIQKTTNERERTVKSAELAALVQKAAPQTVGKKISAIQSMAQLLNPKTAIRNVVGNGLFATADTSANALGAVLDLGISKITGTRTRVMPQFGAAAEGFVTGAKSGYKDALKGIDTSGNASKFDIPQGFTFKNPILRNLEKAMNVELRAPDRAFYEMARNESLMNQLKASGKKEITPEMIAAANEEALYKTFQDDSASARLFKSLKRGLNIGKDFGLGDFVLKYPKTPGNLLSRAFAYSPAGFLKTIHLAVEPFFKKQAEFNQRAFVDSMSRAMVGTGLIGGTGYLLSNLGLITGAPAKDKDIRAVQREQGERPYSINATGLMRFASTMTPESAKPQTGDQWFTYDWAQPMAVPLAAAVNAFQQKQDKGFVKLTDPLAAMGRATLDATDTLTQQSVVQGLEQFFSARSESGQPSPVLGVANAVLDAPSSFVPTALSQANQLIDNKQRETYSPDKLEQSVNEAKAKIPGLAQTLPERKNIYGGTQERYQNGSNNLYNVFLNPAFTSALKSDPTGNEILKIFKESGETKQAPSLVPKKVKIHKNGYDETIVLKPEQLTKYQEYVGKRTKAIFDQVVKTKAFQRLDNEHKAKALAGIMTEVNTAAKIDLFGHQPTKRQSFMTRAIRRDNIPLALSQAKIKLSKAYITQMRQRQHR